MEEKDDSIRIRKRETFDSVREQFLPSQGKREIFFRLQRRYNASGRIMNDKGRCDVGRCHLMA